MLPDYLHQSGTHIWIMFSSECFNQYGYDSIFSLDQRKEGILTGAKPFNVVSHESLRIRH